MSAVLCDGRLLRREILRILDVAYVQGATVELIAISLVDGGYAVTETEVVEHLVYMRDKGYVEMKEVEARGLGKRQWARLTPQGKDLLEGNSPDDPGIMPGVK